MLLSKMARQAAKPIFACTPIKNCCNNSSIKVRNISNSVRTNSIPKLSPIDKPQSCIPINKLLDKIKLEQLDFDLFKGQSEDLGLPKLYGGHVISQSLSAAKQTVETERNLHSFHSYFLLPGDPKQPIIYNVEILRDGKSFSTRRVKAIQDNRPIFFLTSSYQVNEKGFEHQSTMPDVPGPKNLPSEAQLFKSIPSYAFPKMIETIRRKRPFDIRPVTGGNQFNPTIDKAKQYLWIKARGKMPDDLNLHHYVLAYVSDWGFLTTALHPHGVSLLSPKMQVATIDHSMWFHRPFKIDEWLLHAIDSPSASGGRGFVRGEVYSQQGELVASTAQEGLIRQRK